MPTSSISNSTSLVVTDRSPRSTSCSRIKRTSSEAALNRTDRRMRCDYVQHGECRLFRTLFQSERSDGESADAQKRKKCRLRKGEDLKRAKLGVLNVASHGELVIAAAEIFGDPSVRAVSSVSPIDIGPFPRRFEA